MLGSPHSSDPHKWSEKSHESSPANGNFTDTEPEFDMLVLGSSSADNGTPGTGSEEDEDLWVSLGGDALVAWTDDFDQDSSEASDTENPDAASPAHAPPPQAAAKASVDQKFTWRTALHLLDQHRAAVGAAAGTAQARRVLERWPRPARLEEVRHALRLENILFAITRESVLRQGP